MNITGPELASLLPVELTLSIDRIDIPPQADGTKPYAVIQMETEFGAMSIVVYRKALFKHLAKNATVSTRTPEAAKASSGPASAPEGREYYIGKERTHKGKKQRLAGFTKTASPALKPRGVTRRVRNPDTGQLVWPIWEDV